jgi:DNA modification methylase
MKVAMEMGRDAIGYEIDLELQNVIKKKLKVDQTRLDQNISVDFFIKEDSRRLRTDLNKKVSLQKSVT